MLYYIRYIYILTCIYIYIYLQYAFQISSETRWLRLRYAEGEAAK